MALIHFFFLVVLFCTAVPTVFHALMDLNNAYNVLVNKIPTAFTASTHIPPPTAVLTHADRPPVSPPIIPPQHQYPNIRYWLPKKKKSGDAGSGSDSDSDADACIDSDSDLDTYKKPNVLGFLEHGDGKEFSEHEIKFTRQTAQQEFQSYLHERIAPPTWSQATAEVTARFRSSLIAKIPALNRGSNYWKVDAVGTEVYAQWARNRREEISVPPKDEPKKKLKKRKLGKAGSVGEQPQKRSKKTAAPAIVDFDSLISLDPVSPEANYSDNTLTSAEPSSFPVALPPAIDPARPVPVIASPQPVSICNSDEPATTPAQNPKSSGIVNPTAAPPASSAPAPAPIVSTNVPEGISSNPHPTNTVTGSATNISKVKDPLSGIFPDVVTVPSPRLTAVQSSSGSKTKAASGNSTVHVPGKAHIVWNVFGRRYCEEERKSGRRPLTSDVRAAFNALSEREKEVNCFSPAVLKRN
ncbi:hypothetical protein C8R45DRAFT_947791 [Mycena sanguinolenta]|nr:hypothetical protein C8R45DRAFT_947791 [Mycena sanguinolenta]